MIDNSRKKDCRGGWEQEACIRQVSLPPSEFSIKRDRDFAYLMELKEALHRIFSGR